MAYPGKTWLSELTQKSRLVIQQIFRYFLGLFRRTFKFLFGTRRRFLICFNALPPDELFIPDGLDVEIREVRPEEVSLIPREVAIPLRVLRDRWGQGSKMYGAFWEGKIIYYSWIFLGGTFHDRTDGFSLTLNPNEAYCFDYKGVSASVPRAFRSFRLLSALIRVMLNQQRPKLGDRPAFFALVDPDNKISTNYHFNILKGWSVATMNLYRFLWWKWVTKNPASINLKSIREEITWPSLEIKELKERERKYREQDVSFGAWTLKTKSKWWNQVELWNVLKALKVKNGDKVLDIGCSDGRFLEYLHNRFPNCQLFGIDFARNPLKELRKKPFLSQAVCGDVTDLPFKPASFDRAVAIQVTQHLPSKNERIKGLKNIHSVLKENGILSISVDNQNTWADMVENGKEGPFIHTPDLYIYLYNPIDLKEELEEAGFFEVNIKEINNLPVDYLRKLKFLGVWLDLLITNYFKPLSLKRGCYLLATCKKEVRRQ